MEASILSSNILEYLKTVKLNSTLRKLYRNNLTNLHGTVSLISTNNLELLDHSSNNFSPIHSSSNVTSKLPDNIIKFSRRYLIYSLSNGTNPQEWKQKHSPNCLLCNKKETQLHLFNNCEAALKRYE